MDANLKRRIKRSIDSRMYQKTDWARSLCQILTWYGDKHPESGIDVDTAKEAQRVIELGCVYECTIDRGKKGFKLHSGGPYVAGKYYHITTRGLPING